MSVAIAETPFLVHAVPGRLRVHLPDWSGSESRRLETRIREIQGVRRAQANPLTRNVLIYFDPAVADSSTILTAVQGLDLRMNGGEGGEPAPPHVIRERDGTMGRVRIAVPGLDRNPQMARTVVDRLVTLPGVVRAKASPLTGRVLVEFDEHRADVDDLISRIASVDLPDLPGEDRPDHPLDPGPLFQSAARTAGASLGLTLLGARQLTGFEIPPTVQSNATRAGATIGILQGFPFVRNGLRRLFGRDLADLFMYIPTIVSLTLAGSPLGLAVTGAEALRLLTEIVPRRRAWRRYEERLASVADAEPGAIIRLESGERTPLAAGVVEGYGTATGRDGLPMAVAPGTQIPSGARLFGGPFVLDLQSGEAFVPEPRPAPPAPTLYSRYLRALSPMSLAYAALTAVLTRSIRRAFAALLLVNPRTALIGHDAADVGASARVLRSGVIVVGTRQERTVRLPGTLLVDGPRVLTDGFEITSIVPLNEAWDAAEIMSRASAIAAAAGSPWGGAVAEAGDVPTINAVFDGVTASGSVGGARYSLGPVTESDRLPAAVRLRYRGEHLLALRSERERQPLGLLGLRPRLAPGVAEMVEACRRHGVEIALLSVGDPLAAQVMAQRVGLTVVADQDAVEAIRGRQETGELVAFLSDTADAAPAFAACDLAIGLTSGRSSRFPARADLLAPDLLAVAGIIEAGARRDDAVRDSLAFSVIANISGAIWGLRGGPGIERASYAVYITAVGALADGWVRLRGGERPLSTIARLVDPRPERWGGRSIESVLRSLHSSATGLTSLQAAQRWHAERAPAVRSGLFNAILAQIRSPLTAVLAAGAGLSVVLGSTADVVMIGATIAANALVGAWQERQAGQAVAALERIGSTQARVLRDGEPVTVPTSDVVPGDVLVLAPGDRVAADARIISAQGLEVDEAALTGESFPVSKTPENGTDASRIVLAGSDVTVGTGLAVVFAVGRRTRMGATAAALAVDETQASPLGVRLNRMLRQILPLAAAGGLIVFGSGFLRGQPILPELAVAAAIAIAAVPEGLPLLAGVGEAAVARRLAKRSALVRRLSAVEALGRVDVACTDKTGTLTEGRLALRLVASLDEEAEISSHLSHGLRDVVLAAALSTPHPDAADAAAHPTDVAVSQGAEAAGLAEQMRIQRDAESPFDPARPFHAAIAGGKLSVKGAVEELVPRCFRVRRGGEDRPLDEAGRQELLARAQGLAEHGLRVLMVAGGSSDAATDDPRNLVALGFVGISDPLRADVPAAVRRCHDAGVRVVMLTGDHPATARAIAREAGLLNGDGEVLTAADIAELQNGDLDRRLNRAVVIARVTPLDKLRIVESLQRQGHTVAMTGDGVNDAPALRLADVGVAMGRGGTEVARQAADMVLADDDFSTLVEALVEGRSFWRNIRRALGLLLGGNLGELGLMVGASVLGLASPLITRQILAVNLVTDVLPSLAVALQPPESRDLSALAREGTAALDTPLRNDVLRRGGATAGPSLMAYFVTLGSAGLPEARSVAFASVVATQLAQTLDAGRAEGTLTRSVLGAVAGSAGLLVAALTVAPLRAFLGLVTPGPLGWALVAGGSIAAVGLGRALTLSRPNGPHLPSLSDSTFRGGRSLLPAPA